MRITPLLLLIILSVPIYAQDTIQCLSYNIRYDNPKDGINNWHNRKQELTDFLAAQSPDAIGLQECLWHQLQFIDSALTGYAYIGVGRDDGKLQGEFSPILYDTAQLQLIKTYTKWLAPNTDSPSVGWDAALPRIATYGEFIVKKNGRPIVVINTHFDHIGDTARMHSAEMIVTTMPYLKNTGIIVMGDLNCTPAEQPYQIFTRFFDDTRKCEHHSGPEETFNGFSADGALDKRIDYIFSDNFTVVEQQHIVAKKKDGLWLSDHLPVAATLVY